MTLVHQYRCPDCSGVFSRWSRYQGNRVCPRCGKPQLHVQRSPRSNLPVSPKGLCSDCGRFLRLYFGQGWDCKRKAESYALFEGAMIAENLERRERELGSLGSTPHFKPKRSRTPQRNKPAPDTTP